VLHVDWVSGEPQTIGQRESEVKAPSSRPISGTSTTKSTQSTGTSILTSAAVDIWRRDEVSGYPLKYGAIRVAELQGLDIVRNNRFSILWVYVVRIKASCSYLLDSERYQRKKGQGGGCSSGYPWDMATEELGDIKADAISRGDTLRLPYDVVERMGVHRYFK
jgi:hypothetical protein